MSFRIFKKSLMLAFRARKRFLVFVGIYAILIAWTALGIQESDELLTSMAVLGAVVVATFYGILLATFRKTEIATLKCIGWSNGDIKKLILGEILLVSLMGFLIVTEVLVHSLGIQTYFVGDVNPPIESANLLWTFLIIVILQIPGVMLANLKMGRVRPMVALRMT